MKSNRVCWILEWPESLKDCIEANFRHSAIDVHAKCLFVPLEARASEKLHALKDFILDRQRLGKWCLLHSSAGWWLGKEDPTVSVAAVEDHLALWGHFEYPPSSEEAKEGFLDLSVPYDLQLVHRLKRTLTSKRFSWESVVVFSHPAPWMLSPAERVFLRTLGVQIAGGALPLACKIARTINIPVAGFVTVVPRQVSPRGITNDLMTKAIEIMKGFDTLSETEDALDDFKGN